LAGGESATAMKGDSGGCWKGPVKFTRTCHEAVYHTTRGVFLLVFLTNESGVSHTKGSSGLPTISKQHRQGGVILGVLEGTRQVHAHLTEARAGVSHKVGERVWLVSTQ
jgi:hypothetical protein